MQLILRPVSDTRLQEIIVTDSRFAIGRNEGYFKDYDRSLVQKLSRRHARIFERDGHVFVADLDSSNGTSVNGRSVDSEPVPLQLDDELEFGGLRYRVEHMVGADAGTVQIEPAPQGKIVLEPVRADSELQPIVVSKFPFLISRQGSAFAPYQQSAAEHLSQLSKKHAHFYLQSGAVHIEDLGSTNGTFVCNQRLSEQSRELVDHDTIAFGGDYFVYEVRTFIGKETIADADCKIEGLADGTIFVDDATNFFEIYMGGGAGDGDADEREEDLKATNIRETGNVGRKRRFLMNLRNSLRGGEPVDQRMRWTIALAVAVLAIGLGGYWYVIWPVQQTTRLLEDQQFLATAERANEYLRRRPNDDRLQDLATEAVLKAYIPEWQAAMEQSDYPSATRILRQMRQAGSQNPKDDEVIATLDLATRLSAIDIKGGSGRMSIGALTGDESAFDLIAEWDSRIAENARALSRVVPHVASFEGYRSAFSTRLRELRRQEKDNLPLLELRTDIAASLADRDSERLRQQVKAFSDERPDVEGLDALHEDLLRYEAVEQEIDDGRWLSAYQKLNGSEFHTVPFTEHAAIMNVSVLPDRDTRAAYEEALNAWKEGDALRSFEILEALENRPWGEDAGAILDRNRSLLTALGELQTNQDAEDFEDRLFELYGQLDPEMDDFLRRALQPVFREHSQSALAKAGDRLREAESAWSEYNEVGPLRGLHRLEEQVSAEYRNLARLLMQAYQSLRQSEGIYRQLDASSPDSWTTLNGNVIQEIKLQTRAIGDLLVIEPDIQKAKLDLLPRLPDS